MGFTGEGSTTCKLYQRHEICTNKIYSLGEPRKTANQTVCTKQNDFSTTYTNTQLVTILNFQKNENGLARSVVDMDTVVTER